MGAAILPSVCADRPGLLSGFPVSTRNPRSSAARKVAKNTLSRGNPWNPLGECSKERGLGFWLEYLVQCLFGSLCGDCYFVSADNDFFLCSTSSM